MTSVLFMGRPRGEPDAGQPASGLRPSHGGAPGSWVRGDELPRARDSRHSRGGELSVCDGCGGIWEEDIPRVLDVGWQGSNARTPVHLDTTGGAGAGLGLAIVKGIVEAHLGQVGVANQEPGCRFLVRLPA
jgi:signal transduction histidine kinase